MPAFIVQISSDEPTNKSAAQLADVLLDPEWGYSDASNKSAFNYASGTDLTIWQWFEGVCVLCSFRDVPISFDIFFNRKTIQRRLNRVSVLREV